MKMVKIAPFALVLAACASSQQDTAPAPAPVVVVVVAPKPAPLDPAGSYEFTTVVDGQTVTGTMQIGGTPGAYNGTIVTSLFPEIPIVGVVVEGNAINIKASMPDGELSIHMVFEGSAPEFKGNWALGGDTGDFNGKKLPKM